MPIHILPPEVASQIAAGEVVERPASVVKELLENALDAGATQIDIITEEGGQKLIELADNGHGIPADELSLAIERHATSKLATSDDLFNILTLGFRGEALASIGSVSRLTLTSAVAGAPSGTRITVEGGHASQPEPIGAPQGTVIRVEDLFYNVPARKAFLKKEVTERRRIAALVTRYAFAYPNTRFKLTQNGRTALQTSGNGDRREVLANLYNATDARQMLEVNADYDNFRMTGFISPPSLTRGTRNEMTFFVNGRWVQDGALITALRQAFHTMLMVGRFPIATLFIELHPDQVDVNVHPAKSEVRFKDSRRIFSDVQRAVRRALLAHAPVQGMDVQTHIRWTPPATGTDPQRTAAPQWGWQPPDHSARGDSLPYTQPRAQDVPDQPALPQDGRVPLLRLVGQIANSYLIAEGPDGLYLVDQHAAHERVLFERFMAARNETIASQNLLTPITVELPAEQAALIEDQLDILSTLGFQVEAFGRNTFIVRAIPALLTGMEPAAALRVLIEDFEEDETPFQTEVEAKIIARVCKRAAVKAGQSLSPDEQQALLRDLEASTSPRTCPHGRPTMIHLSVDLLERQFGRKGAR